MSNTANGYNGSTDFLKWYKGVYGKDYNPEAGLVRKEGMSDGDWDVGTILHNYYIKNQQNEADRQEKVDSINQRYNGMIDTARAGYDSARQALGENKATAQQNASITYDRLKKYLPMKAKAQGLGGLGTESSGLEAYNTYMTQMGGIASDYQGNMRAIDNEETSALGELERYRADSLDEADTLYDSLGRSYADSADNDARAAWDSYVKGDKASKDEAYAMAQSVIGSSSSSDVNELLAYISGLDGKVSAEQFAALTQYAKNVADDNRKANETEDNDNARGLVETVLAGLIDTGDLEGAKEYLENNKTFLGAATVDAYTRIIDTFEKANEKATEEEETATREKNIIEGKDPVTFEGNNYVLGEKLEKTNNEILSSSWFKERLASAGYSDPYDTNIPNGTTVPCYTNLGANEYVTYFNGAWYRSSLLDGKNAAYRAYEELDEYADALGGAIVEKIINGIGRDNVEKGIKGILAPFLPYFTKTKVYKSEKDSE